MNRPQVAYFLSGPLVYFPSGVRKRKVGFVGWHVATCQGDPETGQPLFPAD
jgi:hypothetical protein